MEGESVSESKPMRCEVCGHLAPSQWHYPADNLDLENLPAPGEIVVVYYRKGDEVIGPTLMTPVHEDGPPTVAGLSIYQPIVRWCAIPAE